MTPEIARAIYLLASAHSHAWTCFVGPDECAADWSAATAKASAALAADQAADREYGYSSPGGLYPSDRHTTASGRLSWCGVPYGPDTETLSISVHRPSPLGGYCVATAYVGVGAPIFDATPASGVRLRHLLVLVEALRIAQGLPSPADLDGAVEYILDRVRKHAEGHEHEWEFRGGRPADLLVRLEAERGDPYPLRAAGYSMTPY